MFFEDCAQASNADLVTRWVSHIIECRLDRQDVLSQSRATTPPRIYTTASRTSFTSYMKSLSLFLTQPFRASSLTAALVVSGSLP